MKQAATGRLRFAFLAAKLLPNVLHGSYARTPLVCQHKWEQVATISAFLTVGADTSACVPGFVSGHDFSRARESQSWRGSDRDRAGCENSGCAGRMGCFVVRSNVRLKEHVKVLKGLVRFAE
jgi:hypothetical protein